MPFSDAIEQFRRFLRDQGQPGPLVWITPSDLMWSGGALLIRPRAEAADETERVFNEATEHGYGVSLEAIARLEHSLCCFVFAPATPEEAAADFVAPPMTMKVRQDLRSAKQPSRFRWWLREEWLRSAPSCGPASSLDMTLEVGSHSLPNRALVALSYCALTDRLQRNPHTRLASLPTGI